MGWSNTFKKDFRKDYASKILRISKDAADAICHLAENKSIDQNKQSLDDTEHFSTFLEFIYFYLHLTDRFAVNYDMNKEDRRKLITLLADMSIALAVESVCQRWPEDTKENIKEECKHNFDIALMEYSECKKELPEEGENPQGTLFWEFGKKIAMLAGQGGITFVLTAQDIAVHSLTEGKLDIKSFIEKAR